MKDKTKIALFVLSGAFLIAGLVFIFAHPDKIGSVGFFVPSSTAFFSGLLRNGVEGRYERLNNKIEFNTLNISKIKDILITKETGNSKVPAPASYSERAHNIVSSRFKKNERKR